MKDLLSTPDQIKPGDRVTLKMSLVVDGVEKLVARPDDGGEFVAITFKHSDGQVVAFTVEIPTSQGETVSTLELVP